MLEALAKVIDPELRLPITELGMVGEVTETSVTIKLTITGCPAADRIERDVKAVVGDREVIMTVMSQAERDELKTKLRAGRAPRVNPFDEENPCKVYLIGSGKGGVGKSSITANIAVALAAKGLSVGLIDADIFGFSIPGQLGIEGKPTKLDDMILPPVAHGVKVISIGMFLAESGPVAWRGPMLHRAVSQFLTDVHWGELDFLLVDMPPGTGDVAISLGQLLPTAQTIVVTTPQVAAADVAERSGSVGVQTGQSTFGVIENMSWLDQGGERIELFGSGGGQLVADRLRTQLLGQVPISIKLREGSDEGKPVVEAQPEDSAAKAIEEIAQIVAKTKTPLLGRRLKLST
ncbi:MAG: P-loop NTPase [Rhodoluna sp.]|nr:P-loop NTPase [Rhodoluna sp.]